MGAESDSSLCNLPSPTLAIRSPLSTGSEYFSCCEYTPDLLGSDLELEIPIPPHVVECSTRPHATPRSREEIVRELQDSSEYRREKPTQLIKNRVVKYGPPQRTKPSKISPISSKFRSIDINFTMELGRIHNQVEKEESPKYNVKKYFINRKPKFCIYSDKIPSLNEVNDVHCSFIDPTLSPVLDKYKSLKELSLKIHSENTRNFETLQRDSPLNEIVNEITLNLKTLEASRKNEDVNEEGEQRPTFPDFHESMFSHSYTYLDSQAHFAVATLGAKQPGRPVIYYNIEPLFSQNKEFSEDEFNPRQFDPSMPLTDSDYSSSMSSIDKASSSGCSITNESTPKDLDTNAGNSSYLEKDISYDSGRGLANASETVKAEARVGDERKVLFKGIDKPGVLEETQLFKSSSPVKSIKTAPESVDYESSPTSDQSKESESRSILKASARLEPDEIQLNLSPLPLDSDLDISDDVLTLSESGSDCPKATFIDEIKLENDLAKISGDLTQNLVLSPLKPPRTRKFDEKYPFEFKRPSTPPPVIFGNEDTEDFFRNSENSPVDCSPEPHGFHHDARQLLEARMPSQLDAELSDYVSTPEPRSSDSPGYQSSDVKSTSPDEDASSNCPDEYYTPNNATPETVAKATKSLESSVIDFDELFCIDGDEETAYSYAYYGNTGTDAHRNFKFGKTYFNPYTGIIKVVESPTRPSAPPWPKYDINVTGNQTVNFVDDKIPDLPSPLNQKLSQPKAGEEVEDVEKRISGSLPAKTFDERAPDPNDDDNESKDEKTTNIYNRVQTAALVEVSQVNDGTPASDFERFLRLIFTPLTCSCWNSVELTPSPSVEDVLMIEGSEDEQQQQQQDQQQQNQQQQQPGVVHMEAKGCAQFTDDKEEENENKIFTETKNKIADKIEDSEKKFLHDNEKNLQDVLKVNALPHAKHNFNLNSEINLKTKEEDENNGTPNSFSSKSSIGFEEFSEKYRDDLKKTFQVINGTTETESATKNEAIEITPKNNGDQINSQSTDLYVKKQDAKGDDNSMETSDGSPRCTTGFINFLTCTTQEGSSPESPKRDQTEMAPVSKTNASEITARINGGQIAPQSTDLYVKKQDAKGDDNSMETSDGSPRCTTGFINFLTCTTQEGSSPESPKRDPTETANVSKTNASEITTRINGGQIAPQSTEFYAKKPDGKSGDSSMETSDSSPACTTGFINFLTCTTQEGSSPESPKHDPSSPPLLLLGKPDTPQQPPSEKPPLPEPNTDPKQDTSGEAVTAEKEDTSPLTPVGENDGRALEGSTKSSESNRDQNLLAMILTSSTKSDDRSSSASSTTTSFSETSSGSSFLPKLSPVTEHLLERTVSFDGALATKFSSSKQPREGDSQLAERKPAVEKHVQVMEHPRQVKPAPREDKEMGDHEVVEEEGPKCEVQPSSESKRSKSGCNGDHSWEESSSSDSSSSTDGSSSSHSNKDTSGSDSNKDTSGSGSSNSSLWLFKEYREYVHHHGDVEKTPPLKYWTS